MPKIKHIALSTQDVEGTARFYIEVFGMKKMGTIDDPGTIGCFLSDGDINLAILNFKNDQAAGVERGRDRPAPSGATTSKRLSEWATAIAPTSR
jgi:catechol 2,3-dioxygenase-like lactoylglutathione lyase family enzyme